MKKCLTVQDGVNAVLDIYEEKTTAVWKYIPAGTGDLTDKLLLNGVEYPLFYWRCDTICATARGRKIWFISSVKCKMVLCSLWIRLMPSGL